MGPQPTKICEQTAGDHRIRWNSEREEYQADEDDECLQGAANAVVMYDRATWDLDCCPDTTKAANHVAQAFQFWAGPKDTIEQFYADNAPELKAAAREVG